jgi:hypothetical protein
MSSTNIKIVEQTADEFVESALRAVSLAEKCDAGGGHYTSEKTGKDLLTPAYFNKMGLDLYNKRFIEKGCGTWKPISKKTWLRATKHFEDSLKERVGGAFREMRQGSGETPGIMLMPKFYTCPHPTDKQQDEWISAWDDDGKLAKMVQRHAPGSLFFPILLRQPEGDSMVMLAIVLISLPGYHHHQVSA